MRLLFALLMEDMVIWRHNGYGWHGCGLDLGSSSSQFGGHLGGGTVVFLERYTSQPCI